jgi:choline dehydrogenase
MASSFSSPIGGDPLESEGIRFTCILELANGSGQLTLSANDPNVQPNLEYHYLEDPWDPQRLREAVRLCIRLLEHQGYRDIVQSRIEPTDEDLATDEALDAWMRRNVSTSQHISGTCKMGPATDPMAVVNQHCQVHGLQGLRVADASVMPNCIRANTNATTIMIAERVADWMK